MLSFAVIDGVLPVLGVVTHISIHFMSAVLGLVMLVFGVFAFKHANLHKPLLTGVFVYILVGAAAAIQILSSGGFSSPFLMLWAIVVFLSGIFGLGGTFIIWLITVTYFILYVQVLSSSASGLEDVILNFLLLHLPLIASYILWHEKTGGKNIEQGTIDTLSNSLDSEKRKADIIINAIGDGVIVIGQSGEIRLLNPAAQEILGWSWEEALNLDYHLVFKLYDEKDQPIKKSLDPFTSVFQRKETEKQDLSLHTKNNKNITISLVASPIKDADGNVTATIGVFRDVSAERQEQKQRADFISTASHEMRTPVAAIEGYLALAANDKVAKIDSKARGYLEKALDSTHHLGKLFQDLLTAAKSEDGRLTSHPVVVEMGDFVEKLVGDLRFTAENKGLLVDFVAGVDSGTGAVVTSKVIQPVYYTYVDPDRMREVVTNIFDNAVKYTEEGKIIIAYTGTAENFTMKIQDTGHGIPKEDIPHLFQKFYRVDNSATRQIGGTGLGLFITKKIVELYNGKIWVESEFGEGSAFFISLPRLTQEKALSLQKQEEALKSPLSEV